MAENSTAAAKSPARERDQAFEKAPRGIRLWPAAVLLLLMYLAILGTTVFYSGTIVQFATGAIAPLVTLVGMAVWLLVFSRLPASDRLLPGAVLVGSMGVAAVVVDPSMVPLGIIMYVLPLALTLPILWLAVFDPATSLGRGGAYVALAIPVLIGAAIRVDGISGDMLPTLSTRWSATAEDQYLAKLRSDADDASLLQDNSQLDPALTGPVVAAAGDWVEFRGRGRTGIADGGALAEDWASTPPKELWRRPVGPGWSSFTLVANRLYTQEQRGEEEAIVCLDSDTGETIWSYAYPGRFYEVVGNAGPRATPTFDNGNIYALGATGKLTAVDAASGSLLWQSDMADDTGADTPMWGFSASPLVVDSEVVIVIAGDPGRKVIAYDADDGSVLWQALDKGLSYSSPQLAVLSGVRQVLVMDGDGIFSLDPVTGESLWSHGWSIPAAARIIQPLKIDNKSLLVGTGYGEGTRKLKVDVSDGKWSVEEEWTSRDMKPYFNDFVLHEGYLYGFDHEIVACIDVSTGKRAWKKGRYGFGQMLLVPEQDVLVVLGEKGELVFLKATPDRSEAGEIANLQAFDGKTWNHPILVRDRLYLRNAEQAVCYQLAASQPTSSQPTSSQPTSSQPTSSQPEPGQPETGQRETGQSETDRVETGLQETTQPEIDRAETGLPETAQPETGQPEAGQPETGQPEAGQPEAGQPETGQPEVDQPAQP
jgi:outer membrane protein assembly factor BamB